jgi:poly(ribitol-phosphate) beta-N-acetylglucosaminyltransferase
MPVKVSVVVPVYNPGPYIEDCVSSLLGQSLPPEEFEAVFVDDGSTDGTPARLDELAAEHENIQVIHQEPSGWSGKPRNVGIEASKGEFVMFVDNDDYLGTEALERMYDYAVANESDVVVGKMAGKGRPVPVELFRRNRPKASVENAPLIDSLTPHKMFRRAFLDRIGLRFPEGRRRLEDHVFVTEAYLRADNVSVLSDYVCYYHIKREDASNAGFQRFEPVGYFKNLREALDVVDRHVEPGPVRDRLFRRWLRVEMTERLRGRRLLGLPEDYRKELFAEIHRITVERFTSPGIAAGLAPASRVVAALAAANRLEDLVALAEWEASVVPVATVRSLAWEEGLLRAEVTAEFTTKGQPLLFPAGAEGTVPGEAPQDVDDAIAWLLADTAARFGKATMDVVLRDRATHAQFFQPVQLTRKTVPAGDGRVRLELRGTVTVDPATARSGSGLSAGLWDAWARVKSSSWTKECRLSPGPSEPSALPGVAGGRVVLPYWNVHGKFSLDVDKASQRLGLGGIRSSDVTVAGHRMRAALPLYVPAGTRALLRLTDQATARRVDVPGTLLPARSGEGAILELVPPARALRGAVWRSELSLVPDTDEPRFLRLPLAVKATRTGVQVKQSVAAALRPGSGFLLVDRVERLARRLGGSVLRKVAPGMMERRGERLRTARQATAAARQSGNTSTGTTSPTGKKD